MELWTWKKLYFEPLYDRIVGRTAMQDVIHPETGEVLAKNGELITDVQANNIVNAGIEKVYIRSVLTCKSKIGVCASMSMNTFESLSHKYNK